MPDPNEEPKNPTVKADHNSNAVGSISAGGDISGNIHIGNVYQTPEDDLHLSSDEIENGLTSFAQFLPERAPVLQDSFSSISKKLRATLGADQNSLSPALKAQREDGVDRMKLMCMEVTDISFRAICLGQNPPSYDSRPPFLGLFAFRPEDREFFFGRDALVQKLVARIKAHPFLAVLGASGSGKSSLVMAGLVPALEAQMSYLTPSSAPLSQLLAAKESASAKTVFVIDQFEELFTHPHDAAERGDFIHALFELTKTNRVVVTMRADFWGEVAIYADLKQAMQEHQELIAPMTVDELHSAMEKQAAVVGLRFDPTLSDSILAEVKGEPGAMPLLQHALWELWNRRHGLWIKAEEYQAFGGVKQAIASTAEEVYASCSDFERARVRDIFLRLTRLDESGEGRDTRRRVLIEELIPVNSDCSVTINLLNKLADARLIVKTDKDVEVAHEALIRHWSRLTEWLNADRDNLRLREGVSESAREWENAKRDDSLLNHRGGRLELALAMSKLPRYQLNPIEQVYLIACVALRHKEQRERERRLRYTVMASIAAAVVFLVLGSFGLIKSNEATSQAETAQANAAVAKTAQAKAETEKQNAEQQAKIARSGELAAFSEAFRDKNFPLSMLLGIEAFQGFDTYQSHSVLLKNTLTHPQPQLIGYFTPDITTNVVYSPNGKILAWGSSDNTVTLWDAETHQPIGQPLTGHTYVVTRVAFSPDGKTLASGSLDGTVILWNVETHKPIGEPIAVTSNYMFFSFAFSPDNKTLALGINDVNEDSADSTLVDSSIVLLDWETHQPIGQPLIRRSYALFNIAFSPDGKNLASIGVNLDVADTPTTLILWNTETRQPIGQWAAGELYPGTTISIIAFSPDSKILALGGERGGNGTVILWNIETHQYIGQPLTGYTDSVESLAFSPDGKILVSGSLGSSDGTVTLWDLETYEPIGQSLTGPTDVGGSSADSLAFSPDGKTLVSKSENTLILWDVKPLLPIRHQISLPISLPIDFWSHFLSNIRITFSPDGKTLASVADNTLILWDMKTFKPIMQPLTRSGWDIFDIVFSPDGETLVIEGSDETLILLDVETLQPIGSPLTGYPDRISEVVYSPDGKIIALGSSNGTVTLWDTKTHQQIGQPLAGHTDEVNDVAFSSDGKTLASGSLDGTVILWSVETHKPIGLPIAGHTDTFSFLAFSPDGKTLAVIWSDCAGVFVDTETYKPIGQLQASSGDCSNIVFSPDGKTLVMSMSEFPDGYPTLMLWDVETLQLIGQLPTGITNWGISDIAFSPDGKTLASGVFDGTVIVWDLDPQTWVDKTCQRISRNFTRTEWKQYFTGEDYRATCTNLPIEAESTPTP